MAVGTELRWKRCAGLHDRPIQAKPATMNETQRTCLIIGIGAGNPDHMTVQGIDALNRADVIFIPDKGEEKSGLAETRGTICERFITRGDWRRVTYDVPARRRHDTGYGDEIATWRAAVEAVFSDLLLETLRPGQTGAFLVWGDPGLYDGTIGIVSSIADKHDPRLTIEIIPGVSSVQALSASHGVALNRTGGSVLVTTGRRMLKGMPDDADSVVVMLDNHEAFAKLDDDLLIYWSAYAGMESEICLSGRLGDVRDEITNARRKARETHGWVMDSYLLRRNVDDKA
jgi:precorrin-6A synthase